MIASLSVVGPGEVALRERLIRSLVHGRAPSLPGVELLPIGTCYRVELFAAAATRGSRDVRRLRQVLSAWAGNDPATIAAIDRAAVWRTGADAARHFLRLASGLESPIPGDRQIAGQVRRGYLGAKAGGTVGPVLDRLAQVALATARRGRRETDGPAADQSVAARAVTLLERRVGGLRGNWLVIGAGEVGAEVARRLAGRPQIEVTVVNRTDAKAERLARSLRARFARWEELAELVHRADGVVLATAASGPVIDAGWLRQDATAVVDLGMPRNAPPLDARSSVAVIDLETIAAAADHGSAGHESTDAAAIVEKATARFTRWLAQRPDRAALAPFRERLDAACRLEIGFVLGPEVTARLARRIVARISGELLSGADHARAEANHG